jgi:DNA-binding transcriptional ArsR family regulator
LPNDAAATERRIQETEEVFSALAHASRRHILLTLWFRGGEVPAGDIAKRFACAWPTISRHLRVLEDAGLVAHEKKGRVRYYKLNLPKLGRAAEWLSWFNPRGPNRRRGAK